MSDLALVNELLHVVNELLKICSYVGMPINYGKKVYEVNIILLLYFNMVRCFLLSDSLLFLFIHGVGIAYLWECV
jgi:hypothetical protein